MFAPTPSEHSSSQLHYYSQLHILVQVSSKFMVVLVYEYGYHASSSFLILRSGGSSAVVGSPLASLGRGSSVLMRRLGWEAGCGGPATAIYLCLHDGAQVSQATDCGEGSAPAAPKPFFVRGHQRVSLVNQSVLFGVPAAPYHAYARLIRPCPGSFDTPTHPPLCLPSGQAYMLCDNLS